MRKIYSLVFAIVAICFATEAFAGVKNLYKQDFESSKDPASIGWASPNYAAGMSIPGDEWGSYFQFDLGTQNNRNAYLVWLDKINYDGIKNYTVSFSWALNKNAVPAASNANTQFSNEVCIFTNTNAPTDGKNGQLCASDKAQWLFAMTQKKGASGGTYWSDESVGEFDFFINNNQDDVFTVEEKTFYNFTIDVDVDARTASYKIENSLTYELIKSGTFSLPEGWDAYAAGINLLAARYNSIHQLDDIVIKSQVEGDFANDPTVALTGVDMSKRTFMITFDAANGEELHVKGTDGTEQTIYESPFTYETETSGTLEVWTVSGTASSEHITTAVDCNPIALPAATAALIGVDEPYQKTYKLSVSNADVPTQPQIFIDVKYVGENGESQTYEDQMSGFEITVKEKGKLTITTKAYGFASTETVIENNQEFSVDAVVDFQHMTPETLIEKGFTEKDLLDATKTSGEGNWTARTRMYYEIKTGQQDDEGKDITEKHIVYGPSANGYEPIRRFQFKQSQLTEEVAHQLFAPVVLWWLGQEGATKGLEEPDANGNVGGSPNPKINLGIGLVHSGALNDDESWDPTGKGYGTIQINEPPMSVDGLTDDDFIIVYKIKDYGSTSKHPVFEAGTSVEDATAQYKAMELGNDITVLKGTETFSMYRVDTAISCVKTYKAKNSTGIQEIFNNDQKVISDHNAPIYNLNGVQVKSLQKGVYIKQGKKFVVK